MLPLTYVATEKIAYKLQNTVSYIQEFKGYSHNMIGFVTWQPFILVQR